MLSPSLKGRAGVGSLILLLSACTSTAYDTGDSRYSYLRTDFVEAQTNSSGQLVSAVTDENTPLTFTQPLTIGWKTTADSLCRTMLYYKLNADDADSTKVEPLTAQRVYTLIPASVEEHATEAGGSTQNNTLPTDPVQFVSAWKSKNGAFLNLCIGVMTGKTTSEDAVQGIGMALDSIGGRTGHPVYYLRLVHSQGSVPQYYTTNTYLSIPTKSLPAGSTVRLSLNTYTGWVYREFTW